LKKLIVQDALVSLTRVNDDDYISLTDIARVRNPDEPKDVVKNGLRNRATVEFLGLWEKINNAAFKGVEFDSFRLQAGSNSFTLSPGKWIEATTPKCHESLPRYPCVIASEARQSIPTQRNGQNNYQISLQSIEHGRKQLSKTEQAGLSR
jgi:hypothetical protein